MSRNGKNTQEFDSGREPTQGDVNINRRRLAKAGVGVPAVLATLASRPVFANACSVSGMQSGNASPQPGQLPCGGCTPGFWQANAIHKGASAWPLSVRPETTFNSIFGDSLYLTCDTHQPLTMLQVLSLHGNEDPYCPNLGMHTVAALLNAMTFKAAGYDYGYSDGDIITMFNQRGDCGAFKDMLDMLNNRGCPLGQNGPTQVDSAVCCKGGTGGGGGGGGKKK